jgi:hypothetical protein
MTTTFAEPPLQTRIPVRPAATAVEAMPRRDLYAAIHKALRSFMSETLLRIGRIDVADAADRDAALAQLDELLDLCTDHLRHENEFVHTAIEARQPAGSKRIAEEHGEHLESIAALRDEARALQGRRRAMPSAARCVSIATWLSSSPRTSSTCTSRRPSTTPSSGSTSATPSSARCTAG